MNAQMPPRFCASATTCRVNVVLPDDSGPYTSTMRPRGRPPQPSAMSSPSDPVGMTLISGATWSMPRRMIEPLPNCFSIELTASSIAFSRWSAIGFLAGSPLFYLTGLTFSPVGRGGKRDAGERRVLGSRRFRYAFVEDHLSDQRAAEVGPGKRAQDLRRPGPVFDPAHGHVRGERAVLPGKPQ